MRGMLSTGRDKQRAISGNTGASTTGTTRHIFKHSMHGIGGENLALGNNKVILRGPFYTTLSHNQRIIKYARLFSSITKSN